MIYDIVATEEEMILLEMYCEAKPFWWRWFFGWRKTKVVADGLEWYYYKVPRKAWELCHKYAKKLGVETVGED